MHGAGEAARQGASCTEHEVNLSVMPSTIGGGRSAQEFRNSGAPDLRIADLDGAIRANVLEQ